MKTQGFWLDDYNFIFPAQDGSIIKWMLMTTFTPKDKDGIVNLAPDRITGKYFDLTAVDPDNFMWKGRRVRLNYEVDW